ncbi:MAG: Gfo/Idh/MocA family oxidoreductase [Phycisphaerae bacterium]|nr:Gfo/Idh/MocA family oxidoreductase [Phycisphaerae bacterium]
MNNINRRYFIKTAGAAGLALAAGNNKLFGADPSDKVVVAVIGIHSRGKQLAQEFASDKNCEVKYVVDVDSRYLDSAVETVEKAQGKKPAKLKDFRKALADKDIDAVVIATPDHWHAPMAIEALKAGKHVYVEKPCSHNPAEGELLIAAQKKYGKLVQMGNQRRSMAIANQMIMEIKDGIIGRAYAAKTWYANGRAPIGYGKEITVPDYLDWDLWQGPAPRTAYRSNVHPYNWHWFWNWGTGESLNNATHEVDVARWALELDFPTKVVSAGGRFHYVDQDDWAAYDSQNYSIEFKEKKMITWEGMSCNTYNPLGGGRGVIIYGDKGAIHYLTDSYTVFDAKSKKIKEVGSGTKNTDATNTVDPGLGSSHSANFLTAILGKNKLNSPVAEGHKSVLLCQLGNIAQRSGTTVYCDPSNGHIIDNPKAQKLWSRQYESGWKPKI